MSMPDCTCFTCFNAYRRARFFFLLVSSEWMWKGLLTAHLYLLYVRVREGSSFHSIFLYTCLVLTSEYSGNCNHFCDSNTTIEKRHAKTRALAHTHTKYCKECFVFTLWPAVSWLIVISPILSTFRVLDSGFISRTQIWFITGEVIYL